MRCRSGEYYAAGNVPDIHIRNLTPRGIRFYSPLHLPPPLILNAWNVVRSSERVKDIEREGNAKEIVGMFPTCIRSLAAPKRCGEIPTKTHLTFDMVFEVPSKIITSQPADEGSSAPICCLRTASAAAAAANIPLAPPPIIPILRRRRRWPCFVSANCDVGCCFEEEDDEDEDEDEDEDIERIRDDGDDAACDRDDGRCLAESFLIRSFLCEAELEAMRRGIT